MPNKIWRVVDLLDWTSGYFEQHGIPNPRLDAEVLLGHLLDKSRLQLYLHFEMPVFQEHLTPFRELIKKRIEHTPVSYITNRKEFLSLGFYVDERVLIPRPETEQLVETVLATNTDTPQRLLELGTGSGVIATSLAVHQAEWDIVATDISEPALAVAQQNAETHACTTQITFMSGDLFEPIKLIEIPEKRQFDWIVCNPPYIKNVERDSLSLDVRDHEPEIALFAGDDGLNVIRRLISEAPQYLSPNGKLLFEIGATQADPVRALMDAEPAYCTYEFLKDYAKKDRLVLVSVSSEHIAG
ncbi:MAG: peptide chain release factor N(5)-glutamine methyltransferase [Candidatus Poribacteria bacterium]|nr:peptide chain release factor N(5)-glutamine methyltransferase [Candidatus Poribacteria bacterium]